MKYKVLVIEDNINWGNDLKDILEEAGFSVQIAIELKAALEFIKLERFDFITTDMNLNPYSDHFEGWDILDKIKELPFAEAIPTMVITAYSDVYTELKKTKTIEGIYFMEKSRFESVHFINIVLRAIKNIGIKYDTKLFEIKNIDLGVSDKLLVAKIFVFQPTTIVHEDWDIIKGLYFLRNRKSLKEKIFKVLNKAVEAHANLIVFPELSVPQIFISEILEWSKDKKNLIIIAGSHYFNVEGKTISRCPVITYGKIYLTEKIYPSPNELSSISGNGLSYGKTILHFTNSIIGNFFVLICSDNLRIPDVKPKCLELSPDFIIVPACQLDSADHFYGISESVNGSVKGLYYIYANNKIENYADGRSAFFGVVRTEIREELKKNNKTDFIPKGKICELSDEEDFYIIEADLYNKNPPAKRMIGQGINVIVETGKIF